VKVSYNRNMNWLLSLFRRNTTPTSSTAPVLLTNTVTGSKEVFSPYKAGIASLYSCGPTVYSRAQIGNLRAYIFSDLVARILSQAGYRVRRVINITDVGHLVSDADEGEDKMSVASMREGKTAEEIADTYTRLFIEDLQALSVDTESIKFPRATEYIPEQIALIELLEKQGFTYRTSDGIYFDTARFPAYGAFAKGSHANTREAAFADIGRRITSNKEKHHPADFALWRFSTHQASRLQEWKSPWGSGFPGWHVECSAMARALLGQPIDIHTGGIDHIPVHHTNEIAQSVAAYQTPLARYWMHQAFLTVDGTKVSKSLKNEIYLSDIMERGFDPLALRYFFLQAHYSSTMSFTWEALAASNEALSRLRKQAETLRELAKDHRAPSEEGRRLLSLLRDDVGTPQALAYLWEVVKDEDITPSKAWDAVCIADEVFGLGLTHSSLKEEVLPAEVVQMAQERDSARQEGNFTRADELRIHIENRGYRVDDGPSGTVVTRVGR
jgi:cysteinyl-tRNA synthetase